MNPRDPRAAARARGTAPESAAPADDLNRVLDSIRAIVRMLRVSGRASEQVLGVNGAQLFVLQRLAETPAHSLAELAARTHTDPSSVSVVVSRLVERDLVTREVSADDGRRVTIALTAAGRGVVRRAPRAAQTQLIEAASELPPKQLRALARGLADLVARMAESPANGAAATQRSSGPSRSGSRPRPRTKTARR